MKKVLLVGNGFDIAHGLKTKYSDFLFLIKNWDVFCKEYSEARGGGVNGVISKQYISSFETLESKSIEQLGEYIKDNSWIKYYSSCGSDMDGWVDFEKEIYPVIDMFETLISGSGVNIFLAVSGFEKYYETYNGNVILRDKYKAGRNKIKKKLLLDELRKEFDDFILALELYLYEFVYRQKSINQLAQIQCIKPDYLISFNYTLTEEIYGIKAENVHHIHGKIREKLDDGNNNMVLGIDEREFSDTDFMYYMKFFQRIQKRTGTNYKRFISKDYLSPTGVYKDEGFILYIFGHSLDRTDADIIKFVIGEKNIQEEIELKPQKIVFFFLDQGDYERKVINLIKIYGRVAVEVCIENGSFEFVEIE